MWRTLLPLWCFRKVVGCTLGGLRRVTSQLDSPCSSSCSLFSGGRFNLIVCVLFHYLMRCPFRNIRSVRHWGGKGGITGTAPRMGTSGIDIVNGHLIFQSCNLCYTFIPPPHSCLFFLSQTLPILFHLSLGTPGFLNNMSRVFVGIGGLCDGIS